MNAKKMVVPIAILVMMVAAIFVMQAAAFTAPNANNDRVEFAYSEGNCNGLYVNMRNCTDPGGINDTPTLRIYGEDNVSAAFPYTDPEGPFDPMNPEAPGKDFVTFNPAYISEAEYGVDKEIIVDSSDANEKTFVRQWYVPEYPEPRGDVWIPQETVHSADIVTEYSYMLLGINNMPVAGTPVGTNFWFPIGSRGGQIGLDSFNLTTGTWAVPVEDPTMVSLKDVGDYNSDGMKDVTIEIRDPVCLYDTGTGNPDEWIEFLDHRIYVTDVAQVGGGDWAATVDVYYIGNDGEQLVQRNVDLVVRAGPVAFGRHTYDPDYNLCFDRPWYIEATSHSQEWVNGTLKDSVKVRVGRRLHMNETFFVDGAEYDIAMIYGPDDPNQFTTFKYITLRNPTPKHGDVTLGNLSIVKKHVDECDQLPMLPPFNMNHKIVDDIGIPHYKHGLGDTIRDEPDGIKSCADKVEKRIVTNQPPFVSYFVDEDVETRFKTNLLEILDESDPEGWNMLCTWTLPWSYTAMVYPDVGDMTCGPTYVPDADFIVTTSGPANYTSPQPTRLEGDVTDTGLPITGADAQLVAQHIVGTTTLTGEDAQAADVNDDMGGVTPNITGADLQLIKQYIVGTISVFPGGQYIP